MISVKQTVSSGAASAAVIAAAKLAVEPPATTMSQLNSVAFGVGAGVGPICEAFVDDGDDGASSESVVVVVVAAAAARPLPPRAMTAATDSRPRPTKEIIFFDTGFGCNVCLSVLIVLIDCCVSVFFWSEISARAAKR